MLYYKKMASQIIVYSYANDPNSKQVAVALPPEDVTKPFYSDLSYNIFPIYNNDFKQIGVITRVVPDIYTGNDTEGEVQAYGIYNYTIWFSEDFDIFKKGDSINYNLNLPFLAGQSSFFVPGEPINSVIINCSGSIWDKTGTVQLLAFDNEVKSRMYTITLY